MKATNPLNVPTMSPKQFFTLLLTAIIGIDMFVGTLAGLTLLESHRQYQQRAEITTQNLAMAVSNELSSDFEKIDLAIQSAVDEAERQIAEKGKIDGKGLDLYLERLERRIPEIFSLRMADEQGNVTHGRGATEGSGASIADREYFFRQRNEPNIGLAINAPVFARIDKKWAIPVSHRINGPDGRFAGVIYANVSIEHIKESFANIEVGKNGSVALRTQDGALAARYPMLASPLSEIGTKVFFPEIRDLIEAGDSDGTAISRYPADNIERTVSFRKTSRYPFFVLIGFAVDDYMAEWRHGAIKVSIAVGFFFLITLVAGWWVNRSWKQYYAQQLLLGQQAQRIQSDYISLEQTALKARKLAKAVEQSPAGAIITDIDGVIEYVNPKFTEVTGYTAEEAIGQTPRILKSGLTPLEVYQDLWRTILSGKKWHGELLNRKKNGELFWEDTLISPLRGEDGAISHFIVVKEDITELKRTQEQLLKSHAQLELKVAERTADLQQQYDLYHSLIEAQSEIGEGVFIVKDDRIVFANEALCQMYGYSEEQLKALPSVLELAHPDDRAQMAAHISHDHRQHLPGEHFKNRWEIGIITREGLRREAEMAVAILPSADSQHIVVVMQDITERRKMAEELQRAKDAAEQANRAKSDFLATMSHEIRTPMNGIIGMTELALDSDLDATQRDYLSTVRSSAESLLVIINDILDFSKIEAGKFEIESVPFNLHDLVADSLKPLAVRAANKGLEFRSTINAEVPVCLNGDPTRLRQILVNLVGNAVKFTETGEIAVSLAIQQTLADAMVVHFAVQDTGAGIPADKQAKIFEPFSQADSSTTRRFGGTGLGLSISTRLVELMGGRIWLESEAGRGSCFHFTIRFGLCADLAPHTVQASAVAAEKSVIPSDILLVEDNPVNRRLAMIRLEQWGHRVTVAENGQHALDILATRDFDLILMDVQMPVMGGFDATARIRDGETPGGRRTPILAMTANAMNGDRERCLAAGMDGYVAKPFRTEELFNAVERILTGGAPLPEKAASTSVPCPTDPGFDYSAALTAADQEVIGYIGNITLDGCTDLLVSIIKGIGENDQEVTHRATHSLKGVLGNYGETPVLGLVQQAEMLAATGRFSEISALIPAIEAEIGKFFDALQDYLAIPR